MKDLLLTMGRTLASVFTNIFISNTIPAYTAIVIIYLIAIDASIQ